MNIDEAEGIRSNLPCSSIPVSFPRLFNSLANERRLKREPQTRFNLIIDIKETGVRFGAIVPWRMKYEVANKTVNALSNGTDSP